MAMNLFNDVQLYKFEESGGGKLGCAPSREVTVTVEFESGPPQNIVIKSSDDKKEISRLGLDELICCQLTEKSFALRPPEGNASSVIIQFPCTTSASSFRNTFNDTQAKLKAAKGGPDGSSIFDKRTDKASASQYFQFYGYLSQQQNMLQDYVRTSTYFRAIISNLGDFKDKVVLDVGAGSGILSFFAVQAGAARVYAVEASSMALHCESLVKANGCEDKIKVVAGKIEEISIPEMVDVIVSEPMGYMLLNERMLESFIHARKFLRPGGKMYPSRGDLHIAPFTDEALFLEQSAKASFWCQDSFHGVNLSHLRGQAIAEYFKQPVVDTFHVGILMSRSHCWSIDFAKVTEEELFEIDIPLRFQVQKNAHIHGLAFWFDVAFVGCSQTVWLSTSPTESLTHWYQVRCLLQRPLLGKTGQEVTGRVQLHANTRQSYDVDIDLTADGRESKNSLDLKNPCFRYGGQIVAPPPGSNTHSPTEAYWATNSLATAPSNDSYTAAASGSTQGSSIDMNYYVPPTNGTGSKSTNGSNAQRGGVYNPVTMYSNSDGNAPNLMDLLFSNPQAAGGLMTGGIPTAMSAGPISSSGRGNPGTGDIQGLYRPSVSLPSTGRSNQFAAAAPSTLGSGGSVTSIPLKIYSNPQQPSNSLPFSSPAYPVWSAPGGAEDSSSRDRTLLP